MPTMVRSSPPLMSLVLAYEPRRFGHFGLIFDQNFPFLKKRVLVRIKLRGAIVELAQKPKNGLGLWVL